VSIRRALLSALSALNIRVFLFVCWVFGRNGRNAAAHHLVIDHTYLAVAMAASAAAAAAAALAVTALKSIGDAGER